MMKKRFFMRLGATAGAALAITLWVSANTFLPFGKALLLFAVLLGLGFSLDTAGRCLKSALSGVAGYGMFSIIGQSLLGFIVVIIAAILFLWAAVLGCTVLGYCNLIRRYLEADAHDRLQP